MYKRILSLLLVLSLLAVGYTQTIEAKAKKKEGCYGKFPKPQGDYKVAKDETLWIDYETAGVSRSSFGLIAKGVKDVYTMYH